MTVNMQDYMWDNIMHAYVRLPFGTIKLSMATSYIQKNEWRTTDHQENPIR